jgi:O-antigen ligase
MLTLDRKIFISILLLCVALSVLLLDKIVILIPATIFLFLLFINYKPAIIISSFVALISFTSGFGETERLLVQVLSIGSLLIIFFKEYGLDWINYPKLPVQIIILVSGLLFTIIFSLFFTNYLALGIQQLIRSLLFFVVIYLYYSFLRDKKSIRYFISALFAGALIYFVIIFYEIVKADFDIIYLNQNLLLEEGIKFIHRNAIGGFFSICISISIAFLFNQDFNRERKYLLYALVFIFSLGLILTNSRAAVLSLIFSSGYIFYRQNKKVLRNFILILLFLIPVVLFSPIWEYINLYFRLERISTGRDFILETVYNILTANPIIGFGPAATKLEMYNYLPYLFGTPEEFFLSRLINQIEFGHAHNFYLFLYTDLGLPGVIVSLFIPFTFIKMSNRLLKNFREDADSKYYLVLGLQASGAALFIRGLFEWAGIFSYGTLTYDLPFWWVFIVVIYLYQDY